jgi:tetratricopeptide (TPR) repeat protein
VTVAVARRAAWTAFALLVVALTFTPLTNNDIFLHLKTGAVVLGTGRVPHVDDYSALAHGRPYIAHEWLAAVAFRLVEIASAGHPFEGLVVAKVLLSLLIAAALAAAARFEGAEDLVTLPCLALVMILAAARIQERPHLFAWLLMASYLLLLARRRARLRAGRPDRLVLLLVPLQVVWANTHGSFFLGPLLVLLAAAAAFLERPAPRGESRREGVRLGGIALLLAAANLVNPYGMTLLRFPFALTGSAFMEQIYEWLPPYSEAYRTTYMARYYVLWALVGAFACVAGLRLWWRRRLAAGLFPIFVYAVFLVLSLRMNRAVTDFALATLPGVAALLTAAFTRSGPPAAPPGGRGARAFPEVQRFAATGLLLMALAATFALGGYWYAPGSGRRVGWGLGAGIPVRAAEFVADEGLSGNCFNDYASGAWLVYRFHPRVRVAMDSRNDVYGEALYADYQRALADPSALASLLRRIDATFLFLQWATPGASGAARTLAALDDGWRPVMFDDQAVVYVKRDGPYASLWSGRAYRVLDPGTFRPGMWDPAQAAAALDEAGRALATPGGPPPWIARVMQIEALTATGRRDEARAAEARLVSEDPPLAHIHLLLGLGHLQRGEKREALARLERARALNPLSTPAAEALAQASRLP